MSTRINEIIQYITHAVVWETRYMTEEDIEKVTKGIETELIAMKMKKKKIDKNDRDNNKTG